MYKARLIGSLFYHIPFIDGVSDFFDLISKIFYEKHLLSVFSFLPHISLEILNRTLNHKSVDNFYKSFNI
jgi:hypothetical protein